MKPLDRLQIVVPGLSEKGYCVPVPVYNSGCPLRKQSVGIPPAIYHAARQPVLAGQGHHVLPSQHPLDNIEPELRRVQTVPSLIPHPGLLSIHCKVSLFALSQLWGPDQVRPSRIPFPFVFVGGVLQSTSRFQYI